MQEGERNRRHVALPVADALHDDLMSFTVWPIRNTSATGHRGTQPAQGPVRPEESSVMAIRSFQGAIGWMAGAAIVAMALPVAASDEGPSGPDTGRSTFKSGIDV